MNTDALNLIAFEEGFRSFVYLCPAGFPTIGFGRRVRVLDYETGHEVKFPLLADEERILLANRVQSLENWLADMFPSWYPGLSPQRQAVLVSLAYQVGRVGLLKFTKLLIALDAGDFDRAANEYLASKAAKQCPQRFFRGARILRKDLSVGETLSPKE